MRELKNHLSVAHTIKPAAAKTADVTGVTVDLKGYGSALVVIQPGTRTDGTHTPKLQESDDDSSWSDVAAADLVGSFAAIATDTIQKVGYVGSKRYIRVFVTVAGATSGAFYAASVIRGHAALQPAS